MWRVVLAIIGACVLGIVLFVTVVLGPLYQEQVQQQQEAAGGTGDIVSAALLLQSKLIGSRANEYDPTDAIMKNTVVPYWAQTCQNQDGSLCNEALPGHLNCVEFVTAVYALAGDPLPAHPDAETFWTAYQHIQGWQEIPSPSAFPGSAHRDPSLGDLIVLKGGRHIERQPDGTSSEVEYGHIGVVVGYTAPSAGASGTVEVAQADAPGNKFSPLSQNPYIASDRPGNTYTMTIHPDYTIDTWSAYTDYSTKPPTQYAAYTVLGFIHQVITLQQTGAYATSLPPGLNPNNTYVQDAIADAKLVGIPFGYFVRQIYQESGFNPQAVSPMGAVGIAQFLPSTAAGLGVNPRDPGAALLGAARMMAASVRNYDGDYAKALAAYNAGSGSVDYAVAQVRAAALARQTGQALDWKTYLPNETKNYIHVIMGL